MLETIDIALRIFGSIIISGSLFLAITSKEFHETIKWLIKGEE